MHQILIIRWMKRGFVALVILLPNVGSGGVAWGQDPQFGDSTWVAPYLVVGGNLNLGESPETDGPRVAERDRTRMGERILRFPFRVVGTPFRWLAMGAGFGAGLILLPYVTQWPIYPTFNYGKTPGLALGVGVRSPMSDSTGWTGSLTGSLSLKDHRRVTFEQRIGDRKIPFMLIESAYKFRPNLPFYGIGNSSDDERVIYLEEEGAVEASVPIGSDRLRQVRLLGGYSNISARHGYDGVPSIEERFNPSTVPFFLKKSRVMSYGVGADLALINDDAFPSRGIHGRAEVRRVHGLGDTGVEYMQWHLEGRGYLPVFADRRAIALRVVYQGVDPLEGTRPVPYYRLPTSENEVQFAAFATQRFRDQKLLLAHAEYRWEIWDFAWAYVFTQWGAVASSLDQFRYADGHESHGLGFRFGMSGVGAARLEFARGSEGMRISFKGGDF